MNQLSILFSTQEKTYTGKELSPHFLLTQLGLKGSALGAFIGPCQVETEHLVDWEDRLAKDRIVAERMLHFIGEFFGMGLREGVFLQRLLMSLMLEELSSKGLHRQGDDLFLVDRKLSVSIVTASPVSILLHVGINVNPQGAPVPAVGLNELGVIPQEWAQRVLNRFASEWEGVHWACTKVRPVM